MRSMSLLVPPPPPPPLLLIGASILISTPVYTALQCAYTDFFPF
jgi:hypothetical protein